MYLVIAGFWVLNIFQAHTFEELHRNVPWLGGNRHHIQGSIGPLLAQFWYIMDPKMILDSVASNNVSFYENHAFYCFFVHEGFLTILGRELGPSGVSPNQRSRWKHAFSPLKHV